MPLTYITGSADRLEKALIRDIGGLLRENKDTDIFVIVPQQRTLFTEKMLLGNLGLQGSFTLQVFSTVRLANYVFEHTGCPDWAKINDVGRAVVMYEAARSCTKTLKWYDEARHRDGFSVRAVRQIKLFKQAGTTPERLGEITSSMKEGYLKSRLEDIGLLYQEYENLISGRFQDGEDEINALCEVLPEMSELKETHVWFYGFDMIPPIMQKLILSLARCAKSVSVLFPLVSNINRGDYFVYEPLSRAYQRMTAAAAAEGVSILHKELPEEARAGDIAYLAENLFSVSAKPSSLQKTGSVSVSACADLSAEAAYAASEIREMVRKNGWRYGDIRILCESPDEYHLSLQRAFAEYEVPLFMPESRSLQSHPLAQAIIFALDAVRGQFQPLTVSSLALTGYAGLTREEAGMFANFITRKGLRGNLFTHPVEGDDQTVYEPLRDRLITPLLHLKTALREAGTLTGQVTAIYQYLTDVEAFRIVMEHTDTLISMSEWSLSTEAAQVYNRIIESLDQLVEILPEKRRPVKELSELLTQSLAAIELKMLPQSSDAVQVERLNRLSTDSCKALFIIGLNDRGTPGAATLISESEQHLLENNYGLWLGSNKKERVALKHLYIKSAIMNASGRVVFTYPQSDNEGGATRRGSVIDAVREIYPGLTIESAADTPARIARRMNSVSAIAGALSTELPEEQRMEAARVLAASEDGKKALDTAIRALSSESGNERITPLTAQRLYGEIKRISVSRLETYAECPNKHFLKYGIRPEIIESNDLSRKDAGNFCHEALMRYLRDNGMRLADITPEDASERMGVIADSLVTEMFGAESAKSGVSGARVAEFVRTAKRAAYAITGHLKESGFRPAGVETEFGKNGTGIPLPGDRMPVLEGKIDRADTYQAADGTNYVRLIDYKTGGKEFDFGEVYLGIQQQLFVYLAAAEKMYRALPAGLFYFHVQDPIPDATNSDPETIEKKRNEELRMNGIVPMDPDLLYAMSPQPKSVIKVNLTKDNRLDNAAAMTTDEFDRTVKHLLETDAGFVNEIRNGSAAISPYTNDKRSSCSFCPAETTCPYRSHLAGFKKRNVPKYKINDLKRMVADETEEQESEI